MEKGSRARVYANTSSYCKQRDSVMRGLAKPSFSMARPKAAHQERMGTDGVRS